MSDTPTTSPTPSENVPDSPPSPPEGDNEDGRIRRANAEAARYRVERNEARQALESLQNELAALQTQLADSQSQAATERHARLQLSAAAAHGLPAELAERLQGEDAASLQADAERLAALLPLRRNLRTGNAANPPQSRARQIYNRIGGGDQNAFDVLLSQRLGGGALAEPKDGQ